MQEIAPSSIKLKNQP